MLVKLVRNLAILTNFMPAMEANIILISVFVLTSFIGLWHFVKVPSSRSDIFLGVFVILFAFSIIHIVNVKTFFQTEYNPLILLPLNLIFLPFYFFLRYVDSFLSFQVFNKIFETLILIIALVEISTHLLPLGAWVYSQQFDKNLISFTFSIKRVFVIVLLPASIYTLWTLIKSRHKYNIKSADDKIRYRWINEVIILISVLVLLVILPELAYFFSLRSYGLFVAQGLLGASIIIYIGLRNLNVQALLAVESAKEINSYNPETSHYFRKIVNLLEEDKLFTESDLRISDLAERVALSPNYVSKIINENTNSNFNELVNQYRIKLVIEKLKNMEYLKKNIFALAQESGFKSKSTFQTVFRKYTGQTPTQFIKAIDTPRK